MPYPSNGIRVIKIIVLLSVCFVIAYVQESRNIFFFSLNWMLSAYPKIVSVKHTRIAVFTK
ncbi:hypothetical protein A7P25_24455 [Achromobacter xylosoxidans]|nr:hypothetical protein A7P25_24455 [Achromobacter xylosoxidans]